MPNREFVLQLKRVVVTDHAFRHLQQEAAAARLGQADFAEFQCTTEAETVGAAAGADVLITNFAPISAAVLQAMNPGGTVIRYGIGFDNVDVAAATKLGIAVANVPDYGVDTVADHAAACILALCRRLPSYSALIRHDGWARPADVGSLPALSSQTVGFIGFGRIAQSLKARLQPFGFKFLAYDPLAAELHSNLGDIRFVELAELARSCQVVSLHAPNTEQTKGIVNAEFLALLPAGAIIVNTARGALVDAEALADALASGHLAGAALDVFDPEPLPQHSRLREMPNVILTPHAAFYDEASLDRLQALVGEELLRALRGEPLRCPVNEVLGAGNAD